MVWNNVRNDFGRSTAVLLDTSAGGGVVGIIFAIFYNKEYIKDLLKKGWQPVTQEDAAVIANKIQWLHK